MPATTQLRSHYLGVMNLLGHSKQGYALLSLAEILLFIYSANINEKKKNLELNTPLISQVDDCSLKAHWDSNSDANSFTIPPSYKTFSNMRTSSKGPHQGIL